jgi:hypothetical protein
MRSTGVLGTTNEHPPVNSELSKNNLLLESNVAHVTWG